MPNEVLAERTQHPGMRSGLALGAAALWRNKPKFANQVVGRRSHHLPRPAISAKFTKRTNLLFLNEISGEDAISVLARTLAEQTQRPAVGVTSGIGCCHFGRTNYPFFRPLNQRVAEGAAFWRSKPNAVCRGCYVRQRLTSFWPLF